MKVRAAIKPLQRWPVNSRSMFNEPLNGKPLARRRRDFEVATNLAGKMVVDLGVTRNRRGLSSHRIHEDGVARPLAQENATMAL